MPGADECLPQGPWNGRCGFLLKKGEVVLVFPHLGDLFGIEQGEVVSDGKRPFVLQGAGSEPGLAATGPDTG